MAPNSTITDGLQFSGTHTALITPFRNGQLFLEQFKKLIRDQIRSGVEGIVPAGTTGESPTLNAEEHLSVIETAVEGAAGKIKVIAGTGANCTHEAIQYTCSAEKIGADASLQVTPYYNKPSQEGLFRHFRAIAEATRLPIILYNIPGRCCVPIDIATVVRLRDACPNIVGIKESGGDVDRVTQLRLALDKKFVVLSGDDLLTIPFLAMGAHGSISVASNLLPKQISRLARLFADGKSQEALALHRRLYPLFQALSLETNPAPIKAAMKLCGKAPGELRSPLAPLAEPNLRQLEEVLIRLKIKTAARRPKKT